MSSEPLMGHKSLFKSLIQMKRNVSVGNAIMPLTVWQVPGSSNASYDFHNSTLYNILKERCNEIPLGDNANSLSKYLMETDGIKKIEFYREHRETRNILGF